MYLSQNIITDIEEWVYLTYNHYQVIKEYKNNINILSTIDLLFPELFLDS